VVSVKIGGGVFSDENRIPQEALSVNPAVTCDRALLPSVAMADPAGQPQIYSDLTQSGQGITESNFVLRKTNLN
jgi:hypothetical protein